MKFLILSFIFILGCQTSPKRYNEILEGEWAAKILVKDIKSGSSHILNVDIRAIKQRFFRMNVNNPAGMHIASLALQEDYFEYILMNEKKFYKGRARPNALRPLLETSLDPILLHNIVFDIPIEGNNWKCENNKNEFVEVCENLQENLKIEWSDRQQTSKLVKVTHPTIELQIKFISFIKDPELKKEIFSLKIPKGFKIYQIKKKPENS
jgi:hypothetical protein